MQEKLQPWTLASLWDENTEWESNRQAITEPIRRPMKIDDKFDSYSTRDTEMLVKVGSNISVILYADHNSIPAVPRNITN